MYTQYVQKGLDKRKKKNVLLFKTPVWGSTILYVVPKQNILSSIYFSHTLVRNSVGFSSNILMQLRINLDHFRAMANIPVKFLTLGLAVK